MSIFPHDVEVTNGEDIAHFLGMSSLKGHATHFHDNILLYNIRTDHVCDFNTWDVYTQNPWSSGRLQIVLILSRFEVVLIQPYLFSSFTW